MGRMVEGICTVATDVVFLDTAAKHVDRLYKPLILSILV
jgi:hypothetical protein